MSLEDQVIGAVSRRAQALADGDSDALLELLHPSFRWTSHRGETFDREQYLRANLAGGRLIWRRQDIRELRVAIVEATAVAWCVLTDEVEIDGQPQSFTMPVTQTWILTDHAWRCLAGHAGPRLA